MRSFYTFLSIILCILAYPNDGFSYEVQSLAKIKLAVDTVQPILLVANKHSNTLSFVDMSTLKVMETIPTGPNPHEIILTLDQRYAYMSSYEPPGNTISVVDLVKKQMVKEINTGEYMRIHGVAMSPDGKNAYFTAGQTGYIVEIDTKTNEITRGIRTHGKISHMVYVSPDGQRLYTGNIVSGDVSVIDRSSGKLITIIKTGKGAGGMAFAPDEKTLWVTNESDETISLIDIESNKIMDSFSCPGTIKRIGFTNDGQMALITSWQKEGKVIVLDTKTKKEIKRISVGDFAIGVEFSPDGHYAFIGCEDGKEVEVMTDGNEKVISNSESDGIHVINLESLTVVGVIKTGLGPDPMAIWYPPSKVQLNNE